MKGRIVQVLIDKGFCFVRAKGVDYFCHRSALQDMLIHQVREGMEVHFDPTKGPKGPRAENVRVTSPATADLVGQLQEKFRRL